MQKWEYCRAARSVNGGFFVEKTGVNDRINIDAEVLLDLMNILGKDGWELVHPVKDEIGHYYFKRPLEI